MENKSNMIKFRVTKEEKFYKKIEFNYIGININNLIHHIFAAEYYTDYNLKKFNDYK